MTMADKHGAALAAELDWLEVVIERRLKQHFQRLAPVAPPEPPRHDPKSTALGASIAEHDLDPSDRLVLALALAPHLRPQALDPLLVRNPNLERPFTEFGGMRSEGETRFVPSFQTAAFLLAGEDLIDRLAFERRILDDATLFRARLIRRSVSGRGLFAAALDPTPHALSRLCHDRQHRPDLSQDFPARLLRTGLGWDDLVLQQETSAGVEDVLNWLRFGADLRADQHFGRLIEPGYRCLFTGPPGTGKTLTATLIGKISGRDVYRVDLSLVVSKWIGETEKNLASLFDHAEGAGWILFFDEADTLFGQRSEVTQAHDRYANQEVAYMLQRIESLDALVILASNLAANIDEAFSRRFQSVISFPVPGPRQRQRLWEQSLPTQGPLAGDFDAKALARRYEVTGGAIVNIVLAASLTALAEGRRPIAQADIERAAARELWKEGRVGAHGQ